MGKHNSNVRQVKLKNPISLIEAAKILGIAYSTLAKKVSSGEFSADRSTPYVLIDKDDVLKYKENMPIIRRKNIDKRSITSKRGIDIPPDLYAVYLNFASARGITIDKLVENILRENVESIFRSSDIGGQK